VTTSKNITSTTNMSVRLSMAMENYLLSIFRLHEEGLPVTITLLAEHLKTIPEAEGLGTSLPSVGSMVKRMEREGFIKTDSKNKKILFTTAGFTNAETIVRRHRLAERLVVDLFGVELYKAHTEAHLLEHAISPYLETKILAKLGNPSISPYGYPIPGSGYVINKKALKLSKSPINTNFIVDRIPVDDQSLLKYLVENNVTPGQTGSISEINESAGTISIDCSGSEAVFSLSVGDLIWVIPN